MASQTKLGLFLKAANSDQGEAAKVLGITENSMSRKNTGKAEFKASEIKKLAMYYGMTDEEVKYLFF